MTAQQQQSIRKSLVASVFKGEILKKLSYEEILIERKRRESQQERIRSGQNPLSSRGRPRVPFVATTG